MMEELETDIDRSSPIWGGSDCDYRSFETEVASYWSQFYKNELNLEQSGNGLLYELKPKESLSKEEEQRVFQTLEHGIFNNTKSKTEEYFKKLWRDIKAIGFKKEDVNHCIEICETLIREEVEWWKERTDLRKNSALKVPSLVEYYSWYVIWRLCKYHKLVTHPLHDFASKKQSILKKNLPQNTPIISIKLNLNMTQFRDLYVGLDKLDVFAGEHKYSQFYNALNGSEHTSIIEPLKFKEDTVLALFITLCKDFQLIENPEYFKWKYFFNINSNYARKLVSDYSQLKAKGTDAQTHRTLPPLYNKIVSLFESLK